MGLDCIPGALLCDGPPATIPEPRQPPRWLLEDQSDDLRAFLLGYPRLAPGASSIAKPIESFLVEAMEALARRLWVASQFFGDLRGAKSVPTASDHPSAHYPVCGSVTAVGQLAHFLLLGRILRGTGMQQLGPVLAPFPNGGCP